MLQELIESFKQCPKGTIFPKGFDNAHSYRGDYYQLGLEPCDNVPVEHMITVLEQALGNTYTGYKGGEFKMDGYVEVYLSYEGCNSGDAIIGWGHSVLHGFELLTKNSDRNFY